MKASLNWIKEFVACEIDPEQLGHQLTMAGQEIGKIDYPAQHLDNVVVAQIVSMQPHPNANKLTLCEVHNGTEVLQIVCGAKNMKEGDKVALAMIGAVLPGDFTIKKSKIRGEVSFGMMCSRTELQLGEDHSGIMILNPDLEPGTPLATALELDDAIFDIEITPNRPDCLSILGVAREVSAITNEPVNVPEIQINEQGTEIHELTSVEIEDYDLCPRYSARVITGVKVGPSPDWMVAKLEKCGIRSINNIVDITNYVLLELGQPLHAFDYNKLVQNRIIVRKAQPGEKIVTLDEQVRELTDKMLVIADAEEPVAIAGVMGGASSEVTEKTTTVVLESAYFNASSIRRTSKKLGLSTEASYRFERGADPQIQVIAANRASQLIAELAGGSVAPGIIDAKQQLPQQPQISLRVKRLNAILGTALSQSEAEAILNRLQIKVIDSQDGEITVAVPSFRVDLAREIDLIEEVGRIYGYENISTASTKTSLVAAPANPVYTFENRSKTVLTGLGLYEIISCNLISKRSLEKMSDTFFETRNILQVKSSASEQNMLRPSLLPGMLETVARNQNQSQKQIKLFELGRVHVDEEKDFPAERLLLTIALSGSRMHDSWDAKHDDVDFFDLKGIIEKYFETIGVRDATFKPENDSFFRGSLGASIWLNDTRIGMLGEVSRELRDHFDLKTSVFVAEIDTDPLLAAQGGATQFEQLSVFPSTKRDIAMVVGTDVSYQQIIDIFNRQKKGIVAGIELFDYYRGEQIGAGKKSLAFSITYKAADRTLTDEEVEKSHSRIKKALVHQLGCEMREQ